MMEIVWGILGFIITISILVTIHEYGHFIVARWCGVKIIRFSLGFGKPVISWTGKKEGTQYTIAPFPLGGFVQMYGESDKADEEIDESKAFFAKPAWQRFLIAFAGPAVNLIFAILAFSLLYMLGVQGMRPEVVYIAPNSLAEQAGFEQGDILQQINHQSVHLSQDALIALVGSTQQKVEIDYRRGNQELKTILDLSTLRPGDELHIDQSTGLYLAGQWWPQQAIVFNVLPDTTADKMGIKKGDRIIAINGNNLNAQTAGKEISQLIRDQGLQNITLTYQRSGQDFMVSGVLGERLIGGEKVGYLGVMWQPISMQYFKRFEKTERYAFFPSLVRGTEQTWQYTVLTFDMFAKMITGKVSIDNVGGPITIGDMAGKTIQISWEVFLNFLGVVSLSLAVINLLPIPMLDGGHMLFSAIEMIIRRPVNEQIVKFAYRIGATIVFGFMIFVILKDVWRYIL